MKECIHHWNHCIYLWNLCVHSWNRRASILRMLSNLDVGSVLDGRLPAGDGTADRASLHAASIRPDKHLCASNRQNRNVTKERMHRTVSSVLTHKPGIFQGCIDMTGGEAPQNGSSTLFTLISRCVRLFVGDFWCDFTSGDAPTRYSFSPRLMRKEKGDGFRSRTLLCNSEGGAGQGS